MDGDAVPFDEAVGDGDGRVLSSVCGEGVRMKLPLGCLLPTEGDSVRESMRKPT